jgi:hypothetical protein
VAGQQTLRPVECESRRQPQGAKRLSDIFGTANAVLFWVSAIAAIASVALLPASLWSATRVWAADALVAWSKPMMWHVVFAEPGQLPRSCAARSREAAIQSACELLAHGNDVRRVIEPSGAFIERTELEGHYDEGRFPGLRMLIMPPIPDRYSEGAQQV